MCEAQHSDAAPSDASSTAPGADPQESGAKPGRPGLVAMLLILAARGWQIGPSAILPPTCRFAPSCSAYAITAITRHGAIKGGWLAMKRLMRCNPWGGHGYDPVP